MPGWIPIPDWLDLVDILVVAGFLWFAVRFLRGSRARAELSGLALLGVVYGVARALDLELTSVLLQGFFAVLILILVVVFQDDLRRIFGQLGSWRRLPGDSRAENAALDILVRATARMAESRTGALIVLPGREPLERHIEGGVVLHGRLSEPLLLSIFDVSSPGHDGAVVVRGDVVERFAAHLPLSANHEAVRPAGTRHAAALGLAERCDATCIVVSEERGSVSLARNGELRRLPSPRALASELHKAVAPETTPTRARWKQRAPEAAFALLAALLLWTLIVPGSDMGEVTVPVPVEITNLPEGRRLESIEPEEVSVTLRGLRRDLLLLGI
ncbi:MAG TPA: diadenylate cyclase, partial [Myxococcota bacterium]|nr:diadenylate cyclase [Myxococcota bacterium]